MSMADRQSRQEFKTLLFNMVGFDSCDEVRVGSAAKFSWASMFIGFTIRSLDMCHSLEFFLRVGRWVSAALNAIVR